MSRATLIQCTKTKRDTPAPARDLYDESTYYCKMRAYADAKGYPWYILSAKHGLVDPDATLEPYDEFGLSEEQADAIATRVDRLGYECVEVVAGKQYTGPLTPALEAAGIDVIDNFAGQRIGTRQSELDQRTAELTNESLC